IAQLQHAIPDKQAAEQQPRQRGQVNFHRIHDASPAITRTVMLLKFHYDPFVTSQFRVPFFDLDQIRGSEARTIVNGVRSRAVGVTISRENFEMNIPKKLFLASALALSIAAPVQAQSPTQGDYYAPPDNGGTSDPRTTETK